MSIEQSIRAHQGPLADRPNPETLDAAFAPGASRDFSPMLSEAFDSCHLGHGAIFSSHLEASSRKPSQFEEEPGRIAMVDRLRVDTESPRRRQGPLILFFGSDDGTGIGSEVLEVVWRQKTGQVQLRLEVSETCSTRASHWLELPTGRIDVMVSWQASEPGLKNGSAALSWSRSGPGLEPLLETGIYLEHLDNSHTRVVGTERRPGI